MNAVPSARGGRTCRLDTYICGSGAASAVSMLLPMGRSPVAKLVAPRTDQLVHRRRILTAIDRALRTGACWIAAPAGYGKTTALADYLDQKAATHIWYRV